MLLRRSDGLELRVIGEGLCGCLGKRAPEPMAAMPVSGSITSRCHLTECLLFVGDEQQASSGAETCLSANPWRVRGATPMLPDIDQLFRTRSINMMQASARRPANIAKDWRTDKFLRHLEALLLVSDKEQTFLLSGNGT